ncbi:MAG: AAA family ATPase [Inhella sp.]
MSAGMRFGLGLVVGKFSPLHRGHEALVAAAAAQCERLLILSYSQPELPGCEAARRRRWLAVRFPQHECWVFDAATLAARCAERGLPPRRLPHNHAPDAVQQEFLAWLLRELLQCQPDALFANEAYAQPCAARLAQAFGRPVQAVLPDRWRRGLPTSGTALRARPQREFLAPEVWADCLPRIALVGGESSGKSTLAPLLAARLGAAWVPEFGRHWWEVRGGTLDAGDLLHIAREQRRLEDEAARQGPVALVCDTAPLTTLGYSLWLGLPAAPELIERARQPYAAWLLCRGDFPFAQDGTRRDARFRAQQEAWYRQMLAGQPVIELSGAVAQRLRQAERGLKRLGLLRAQVWA